jgi:hypothetical protein
MARVVAVALMCCALCLSQKAWSQSGDLLAGSTCRSEHQTYCEGDVEKSCTIIGQVNARTIWEGVKTGHNENCAAHQPVAGNSPACEALKNQQARRLKAFNDDCAAPNPEGVAAYMKSYCDAAALKWTRQWHAIWKKCPEYAGKNLTADGRVTSP